MVDRNALPASIDVEKLVLGSILLDETVLHEIRPVLSADDFSLESHRRIWKGIIDLYDGGGHVDRVTLAIALRDAGELESIGGLAYLISLDEGLPRLPNVEEYVRTLQDDRTRRRIIVVADHLTRRAANRENPQEILDSIAGLALEMMPSEAGKGLVSVRQLVDEVGITALLSPRIARGVPFPWTWLNHATCGMLAGELWVLAAHTGAGKTCGALQTAVHIARRQSKRVAIFSLEMSREALVQRAVWQISQIDADDAKRGLLTSEDLRRAGDALNTLYGLSLHVDDESYSVTEIHSRLRQLRASGPLGLIVVDYLQLLRDTGRHNTRAESVGAAARSLKLIAGEFECPLLLLSQFSRDSLKRKGSESPRPPELFDLKESGDIENHADGVWFIHRLDDHPADQVNVEFILAKQRDGRRNVTEEFWFFPKHQKFEAKSEVEDDRSR